MVLPAIFLDAMGTLVQLRRPWPLLVAALGERGVTIDEDAARTGMLAEIAYYLEHHDRASTQDAVVQLRLECAEVLADTLGQDIVASLPLSEVHDAMMESLRFDPYPEVPEVLAQLRERGHRLVVVSNWDISLYEVLQLTGLSDLVDGVVISAIEGFAKPDARIFERALQVAGAPAGGAVHVGDDVDVDVNGALNAGLRAVFVDREGAGQTVPPGATVLPDLRGLAALLTD